MNNRGGIPSGSVLVDKGPEAFRTISEVADDLDLPQHVLRFWETRFAQIKPLKRGGGRRYYRPDDVTLLRGIKHLLYGEGYTIKGVQRILREQGPKHVMMLWQDAEIDDDEVAPAPSTPEMFAPQRRDAPSVMPPVSEFAPTFSPRHASPAADQAPEPRVEADEGFEDVPLVARQAVAPPAAAGKPPSVSKDDVRRLQKTLFDLLECKEILDSAR